MPKSTFSQMSFIFQALTGQSGETTEHQPPSNIYRYTVINPPVIGAVFQDESILGHSMSQVVKVFRVMRLSIPISFSMIETPSFFQIYTLEKAEEK